MAGYAGKQGRKPTPTALRLLRGNPGRRPLNDAEPNVAPMLPPPPKELGDAAKRIWRRDGKKLLAGRIITDLDAAQFAAYCASYARWLEATALLAKSAVLIKNRHGDLIVNPLLRVVREAQDQYTRALVEFGMSPSSRSRLSVSEAASEPDPLEALRRRRAD